MRSQVIAALLGLSLLALAPPAAADASADQLAARAAEVHEAHCSDVAAGRATEAAEALEQVTPVLADVSRRYDSSRESFLLYWRGMLNQCLDQDERALTDLRGFLAAVGDDPGYEALIRDARTRIRRLEPGSAATTAPQPGLVAGFALAGAAGAFGGLAGWQNQLALQAQTDFDAGLRPFGDSAALLEEGETAANAAGGLLAGAAVSAAASAVSLIVSAATGSDAPSLAWAPIDRGAVVLVGGRW